MSQLDRPQVDRLVEMLHMIGQPIRLMILARLAQGEQAVGDLIASTGQNPSAISQQLALLRKAGLVRGRREARQVFYALAADRLVEAAQALAGLAGREIAETTDQAHAASVPRSAKVSAAMFAQVQPRA